jgi:hypothetical protein
MNEFVKRAALVPSITVRPRARWAATSLIAVALSALTASCEQGQSQPSPASSTQPSPAAPIDANAVASATGGKPEVSEGVAKVSFPRDDVKVEVDKWAMPPFMGLTSWAAFTPAQKAGVEAMVMGDLVLFEDEVSDAMSAALFNGLEVTAIHNHFFFDSPKVFFMHIGGEGKVSELGKGVRMALDAAKAVRQKAPQPSDHFEGPAIPTPSAIDGSKVEAALGVKGTAKDGMFKVVIGRAASTASCGCQIGKAMGVNTWAAFAGTNENAVVDGDFAVTEGELQPVLRALRKEGVHVVAIHHHMVGENPRILFLHYWGRGTVESLSKTLKTALDLTKTGG